jgi:hypothetical protein
MQKFHVGPQQWMCSNKTNFQTNFDYKTMEFVPCQILHYYVA